MKLCEAMKKLDENPNKVFKNRHGVRLTAKDGWASIDGRTTFPMEDVWEEVKQPVTWQEAIQAWIDGCDIRCEGGGRVSKFKNSSVLLDKLECPPSKWMMKNGKWYVGD